MIPNNFKNSGKVHTKNIPKDNEPMKPQPDVHQIEMSVILPTILKC